MRMSYTGRPRPLVTLKKAKNGSPSEEEFKQKAISQGAGVGESAAKLAAAVFKAPHPAH